MICVLVLMGYILRESVGARTKIRYNGYTCFRGMVEDVQFNDQHVANEYWGVKDE